MSLEKRMLGQMVGFAQYKKPDLQVMGGYQSTNGKPM